MFEDSMFASIVAIASTPSTYLGAAAGASARELWRFGYQAASILSGVVLLGSLMKSHPRKVGAVVVSVLALLALSGCASSPSAKDERAVTITGNEFCETARSDLREQLSVVRDCSEDDYVKCEKEVEKLKDAKSRYSECRNASLDNNVLTHPANIFRSTNGD